MPDSDIRIIATGLGFPEGPVWMADGSVILGEISGKKVTRVMPRRQQDRDRQGRRRAERRRHRARRRALCLQQRRRVYETTPSFLSTGPALDYKNGSIQRIDPKTGETRVLYSECNGHKLSAPNDLVFDKQGGFYFTDLGKRYAHHRDNGGLYYALPDGSSVTELVYPIVTPERRRPVARRKDRLRRRHRDLAPLRLGHRLARQGQARAVPGALWRAAASAALPGFQRFDSLAVEANGNICVATLVTGYITVISPGGQVVRAGQVPDVYPTNICFGGPDLRTAYITLSASGQLGAMPVAGAGTAPQLHGLTHMQIEVICTGDEILTGKIVNTNFSHMAQRLGGCRALGALGHHGRRRPRQLLPPSARPASGPMRSSSMAGSAPRSTTSRRRSPPRPPASSWC